MQITKNRPALVRGRRPEQKGFSLVELLVALVIGLIIILGAGQLFLAGFLNFRQVQLLGEKQSAITYASEVLLRDIRRAKLYNKDGSFESSIKWEGGRLSLAVDNRDDGVCSSEEILVKEYWVEDGYMYFDVTSCLQSIDLDDVSDPGFTPEPIVSGFHADGFSVNAIADGVWDVTFNLLSSARNSDEHDVIVFRAVNRTIAMQSFGS